VAGRCGDRIDHRWSRVLTRSVLALAIVVILGADLFVLTQRNVTTAVSLDQTLKRFRASTASVPSPGAVLSEEGTPALGSSVAPTTLAAARLSSTRLPGRAADAPSTPMTTQGNSPFSAPPEGVYTYATSGYEQISLAGARHDYPSQSFATVRHGSGCQWGFEHRVIQEHVETHVYCSEPDALAFLQETDQVTFFGQTNTRTYRCDPPEITAHLGDGVGSSRQFNCRSDSGGQLSARVSYLGREPVAIDGVAVSALHVVVDSQISGDVHGSSRTELWLHPQTGLALREEISVKSHSPAFGTTVDYEEKASYALEHLVPAT
jgi:hypothetical protein